MEDSTGAPEEWRPVVGRESLYQVSDWGRVWINRLGRVAAQNVAGAGYLTVHLSRPRRREYVHRLVLEAFVGVVPEGTQTCHDDGDPANNALTNLRWDTVSANMLDKVRHGTHWEAAQAHCIRGHLLEPPNLYPSQLAKGARVCIACGRASDYVHVNGDDMQIVSDVYYADVLATNGVLRRHGKGARGLRPAVLN